MTAYPLRAAHARAITALAGVLLVLATTSLAGAPAYADATRDAQWHLSFLGVPEAHEQAQGEGVTVAVIDTGVDANHPDLRGNVLPGIDAYRTNAPGNTDAVGHGTGMASIVAGHGHGAGNTDGVVGIAPRAKILPIKVASAAGGGQIDPRAIGLAMQYAANRGADVILVSLTGSSAPEMTEGLAAAERKGAHVIASAGSAADGPDIVGFPARLSGVAAVSSVDRNGEFSTTSVTGAEIDLAAPGVDIPQATRNGGYTVATGTSSAAAVVAGVAALLISRFPDASRNEIGARLLWSATDKGEPGKDSRYGFGVVNLAKAMADQVPTQPGSPGASPVDTEVPAADPPNDDFFIDWASFVPFWPCLIPVVLVPIGVVVLIVRLRRKAVASPPGAPPGPPPHGPPDAGWQRPTRDDHPG